MSIVDICQAKLSMENGKLIDNKLNIYFNCLVLSTFSTPYKEGGPKSMTIFNTFQWINCQLFSCEYRGEKRVLIYGDRRRYDFGWDTQVQYTDLITWKLTPETYLIMSTDVTPIKLILKNNIILNFKKFIVLNFTWVYNKYLCWPL